MNGRNLILVPVDFSPQCEAVLLRAGQEASRTGSSLLLFHAVQYRDPMRQRPPELLTDPLEDCGRRITQIPDTRVSVLAVEGEPIQKILDTARDYHCKLIIMGRGGKPDKPGHVAEGVRSAFRGRIIWVSTVPASSVY